MKNKLSTISEYFVIFLHSMLIQIHGLNDSSCETDDITDSVSHIAIGVTIVQEKDYNQRVT